MKQLKFSHAAENGVFWMLILLGTLGFLSLFSAGRQAIQTGSGKMKALAEGRIHKTAEGFRPICSVNQERKQAALTFDISGDLKELDGLIQVPAILEENQVKASFFVSGEWAMENPEYIRKLSELGHDIGSMGQTGISVSSLTAQMRQEEIRQAKDCLEQLTGRDTNLFRPAQGEYDDSLITAVCAIGCYPIGWDVDSQDWKDYGAFTICRQVLENENLKGGSIIRFRCGSKYTAQSLTDIIDRLKRAGFELVPLSQMIYKEQYHLDEQGRQMKNEG